MYAWLSRSAAMAIVLTALIGMGTAAAEVRPFAAEDIFALEHATDIQISPDGDHIVFVRNSNDMMSDNTLRSLWLVDVESGQAVPLQSGESSFSQPRWSPSGDRIAYISSESGKSQIHVHWVEQNKSTRITRLQSAPSNLTWSPDGTMLAFSQQVTAAPTDFAKSVYRPAQPEGAEWSPKPIIVERTRYQADGRGVMESAYRHLFVVPADGGTARQLTTGDYNHGGQLAFTPDGEHIVFSANRDDDWEQQTRQSALYQVALADGALEQISDGAGEFENPVFSPNGERLAYLYTSGEPRAYHNTKLRVMNWQDGSSSELLTDFDRSIQSPHWLGNDALVVMYQDRGKSKLARVTLNSRILDLVDDVSGMPSGRPYNFGMFSMNADGHIGYTRGSAQRLGEVGYLHADDEPRTLTALNEDVLGQRDLGEVHEFTYESSTDGETIQAWYITPPGFDPEKTYPLILELHGGPHLNYGPHFSAELQRYAAEGYVVVYNNYRGSTSYGDDFAMLLDNKYSSEDDFGDNMSAVDAMLDMGFIDERNLFIAGGSAGGIASAYAIGLTDRFNAAAVTNPVVNWVSKVLTADSSIGQIKNQFPGMPWEELEHYWKRSPLSLVGNVTTPTLLFTGELDRRTPISDTEQYYQALQLQGVDVAMVRVPGAYHGVANTPTRMIAKTEHALAWFDRYQQSAE
ncbi:S9 family peptidase [Aliidiomarina sp. Khilg15.8]